jgi:hypothetical protein
MHPGQVAQLRERGLPVPPHVLARKIEMENQHRRIIGYRELTAEDIDLMNAIKQAGAAFAELDKLVGQRLTAQYQATMPSYAEPQTESEHAVGTLCIDTPEQSAEKEAEGKRLQGAEPHRWRSIAKTHMQEGLMALTRAVAQPGSF